MVTAGTSVNHSLIKFCCSSYFFLLFHWQQKNHLSILRRNNAFVSILVVAIKLTKSLQGKKKRLPTTKTLLALRKIYVFMYFTRNPRTQSKKILATLGGTGLTCGCTESKPREKSADILRRADSVIQSIINAWFDSLMSHTPQCKRETHTRLNTDTTEKVHVMVKCSVSTDAVGHVHHGLTLLSAGRDELPKSLPTWIILWLDDLSH